ncbi:hypothetical protein VKT23_016406 [Stygiomarasmius scandens]|uniref:LYC1 C-terminal domain-containing protein n=1 Tax=Marasmiellus scandens TaxID=2682957 RepID=A0ABR1IXQ6_9AGAR
MDFINHDLTSLSLFLATPSQETESRRRTYRVWGNGMTEDEYIQRDEECAQSLCGRDGKFKTWILAPRDDPQTLDFKCSCETFQRTGVVYRGHSSTSTEVPCYSIASVFTPTQHRKKGYARHMMRLLHWVLSPESYSSPTTFPKVWGLPPSHIRGDAQFSVLYSDVGDFYASCGPNPSEDGWIIRGANSVIWNMDQVPDFADLELPSMTNWKWLSESDLQKLILQDSNLIQLETPTKTTSFSFLPSGGVEAFQRERQKIFWEKENPPIEKWGVIYEPESDICPTTAFATWMFELKPSAPRALIVTRFRIDPANDVQIRELFRLVLKTAKYHNVAKVEIWDVPNTIIEALTCLGGQSVEREEHLPAFKWYGPEKTEDIAWLHNEKFAWC